MSLHVVSIFLFLFYISVIGTASAASKGGVSKNIETLAKVLYASTRSGFGDNKYVFDKVEIIEVGKNLGRGAPVKFKLKGIHGFKTQSSPPPGWNTNGFPIWVGDTIEAEEPFRGTFVVFYANDEFGKVVGCSDGGYQCVNEENMPQHKAMLDNMKTQHLQAMRQNQLREAEYAQQQRNEAAQQIARVNLEQRRANARVVTETIGNYDTCVDSWFGPPGTGTATLTDVNASYVHNYRREEPYKFEVIFWFDNFNIAAVEKRGRGTHFNVKHAVQMRPGDNAWDIGFSSHEIADQFHSDLLAAKSAWDQKHPEFK